MLVWLVLAALIAACVYIEFLPADVDPELIKHQGDPSKTCEPGESAVYRSPANIHGLPLFHMKGFTISQLWEPQSFHIRTINEYGKIIDNNLEAAVAAYQKAIDIDSPSASPIKVVAVLKADMNALAVFFAVIFLGGTVKMTSLEDFGDVTLSDYDFVLAPLNLLDTSERDHGLAVLSTKSKSKPKKIDISSNHVGPVKIVEKNQAVIEIGGFKVAAGELGTAIAAQIIALGQHHRWLSSDRVLFFTQTITPYTLLMMLTALSSKSQLYVIEAGPLLPPFRPLELIKPTILVSEDLTMRSLIKHIDDFRIHNWIVHGFKRLLLAKGRLCEATMPEFTSVRLIYSETGSDSYLWLDNNESANLRVLTGSQFIHALTTSQEGLPIAQTVLGDYRSPRNLPSRIIFGPPLPGYELKTRGPQLWTRSVSSNNWHSAACSAEIKADGCVYAQLKRYQVSDKYFYTGEL